MQFFVKSGLLMCSVLLLNQAIAAPPRVAPEPLLQYGAAPAMATPSDQPAHASENKVDSNVMYELLDQLNQLKLEISSLREIAEQQEHQMSLLTKRQRSLYQDVDRRMLELEAGTSSHSGLVVSPNAGMGNATSGVPAASEYRNNPASGNELPVSEVVDPALEQAAYTRAFNLLKEGNYSQAITAFSEFLSAFSSGKYADNAQYWLGEANYATRDYKNALVEFQKIVTVYPDSPKRKDAELKIGFTYYELKDWAAAKRALESVVSQYPETSNARTAKQRLERLIREGR